MRALFFILVIFASSISAQTAFEKANKLANSGNYEQSLNLYEQILLNASNEDAGENYLAKIHFNIGICRYHLKQTGEAVAEFTKAINVAEGNYQKAFYALGMAQTDLKNWAAAETAFRNALKLKKTDGEAWFDLALIYLEEKKFDKAEKAFRNSVEFRSVAAADAHNNLGVIYLLSGNYAVAEDEFKTALEKSNGTSIEALNNLRFCYKQGAAKDLIANLKFSRRTTNLGV